MTPQLDKQLCKKYPKIFAQRHGKPAETCMCWGIECGDGWYWLIEQLCACLQESVECYFPPHPQPVALQVKEKFGGLRFYCANTDAAQDGMITLAESMSHGNCMFCGSTKQIGKSEGWIITACQTCAEKEGLSTWRPYQPTTRKAGEQMKKKGTKRKPCK